MRPDIRVCFLGDSFTAGTGDETGLGWVGRVTAGAWARGTALTAYNLGVRRDTSADILRRAEAEVLARFVPALGDRHVVVLCMGANDPTLEDEMPRVPPEASLANAAELLAWSLARWATLMLGPPPVLVNAAHDARAAALSDQLEALCTRLEVPFLPLHRRLSRGAAWRDAVARGDGVHPDSAGYAALAALVEAWEPWRRVTA